MHVCLPTQIPTVQIRHVRHYWSKQCRHDESSDGRITCSPSSRVTDVHSEVQNLTSDRERRLCKGQRQTNKCRDAIVDDCDDEKVVMVKRIPYRGSYHVPQSEASELRGVMRSSFTSLLLGLRCYYQGYCAHGLGRMCYRHAVLTP